MRGPREGDQDQWRQQAMAPGFRPIPGGSGFPQSPGDKDMAGSDSSQKHVKHPQWRWAQGPLFRAQQQLGRPRQSKPPIGNTALGLHGSISRGQVKEATFLSAHGPSFDISQS